MKLKGLHFADVAEMQEAVTDELKKVQKKGIFGSFSETVRPLKRLYICHWGLFRIKKICLPRVSPTFLKKSVLKLLDRTVYVST